ncbi:hypothetical protein [Novosphingobium sp. KN65.2]|uniref:hypothetical protein n=1 Tax=Novosphingobium sp. KN65.2 TaxID=1478134 RepID=UPI0005DCB639|nr:hypothetical protein [Novosphingobium sp. KN65.2]CDO35024.1 conserved hypothetical protein [Novosphingobium sp. KN65.2]
MLSIPTEFPQAGSFGFLDDRDHLGRDVVEQVRILRHNGDGNALVALTGRRFPGEIASGNRTVPLASLRATERPEPIKPAGRKRSRRR